VTTSSLLISRTAPQLTVAQIGGRQITTHTAAAVAVVTNICSSTLARFDSDRPPRQRGQQSRLHASIFSPLPRPSSPSPCPPSSAGLGGEIRPTRLRPRARATSRVAVALENNRGSMTRTVICMEASQVRPRSESIIQDGRAHSQAIYRAIPKWLPRKSQERWQLINMDVFNSLHNGRSRMAFLCPCPCPCPPPSPPPILWPSPAGWYNGVIITRNIRTETWLTRISTRETN